MVAERNKQSVENKYRDRLLSRNEAAEFLGVRHQTLSAWACNGRYGLRFVKIGRRVMYRISDLESFLDRRTITHTGEKMDEL
ncbi:helix-turn-helix domain-containing protein [Marinomonas shanghaiensis]|uniref:helix-turn-helix domain-containing protein n=1 Tax=Marinomonas shanghaiensis TaxID=2202418 RepID=UPI000DBA9943|nr:helix-turn-helix domain-containing protein [Marinomonas shanghaiensis]